MNLSFFLLLVDGLLYVTEVVVHCPAKLLNYVYPLCSFQWSVHNHTLLPPRDTIHILFPHSAGQITKPSIVWLYGTIVCLVLRDISKNLPLPKYIIEEFGMSIIMNFNRCHILSNELTV